MLRIGEFSKLSRVSIRMLRHYDDMGLLKPAFIDPFTGYRYYEAEQLPVIGRITALKDMGFSLADIVRILDIYDDREQLDAYLEKRQRELTEQARETARRLTLIDTARRRLTGEVPIRYDVTIKTIPERYAATVRMTLPRYEDEGMAWRALTEDTRAIGLVPGDPCLTAATFPEGDGPDENVEIMVWKTVRGTYRDTGRVRFMTLPEVKAACCTFKGSYDNIAECYAAVLAWVRENGYRCAGPVFDIYHVSPYDTRDPEEYVTEVCFPIG